MPLTSGRAASAAVLALVAACATSSRDVGSKCKDDGECDRGYCFNGFCAAGCTCSDRLCRSGTECAADEVCVRLVTATDRKPRCVATCSDGAACGTNQFCDREDLVCRDGADPSPEGGTPTSSGPPCATLGSSCSAGGRTVPCCTGTCSAQGICK